MAPKQQDSGRRSQEGGKQQAWEGWRGDLSSPQASLLRDPSSACREVGINEKKKKKSEALVYLWLKVLQSEGQSQPGCSPLQVTVALSGRFLCGCEVDGLKGKHSRFMELLWDFLHRSRQPLHTLKCFDSSGKSSGKPEA